MATQNNHSDVCIVGNGAVGKAAALGLSQAGLKVCLLGAPIALTQSADTSSWDVRVFALNHVAKDLLTSLKVWDARDLTRVAPVSAMQVVEQVLRFH